MPYKQKIEEYKDLDNLQQKILRQIDNIFCRSRISRKGFVSVLGILIKKYEEKDHKL